MSIGAKGIATRNKDATRRGIQSSGWRTEAGVLSRIQAPSEPHKATPEIRSPSATANHSQMRLHFLVCLRPPSKGRLQLPPSVPEELKNAGAGAPEKNPSTFRLAELNSGSCDKDEHSLEACGTNNAGVHLHSSIYKRHVLTKHMRCFGTLELRSFPC